MTYLFDHAWKKARQRLAAMEAGLDPWTSDNLESRGIVPDWRCLEVGAGAGSIARWLSSRVGATRRLSTTGSFHAVLAGLSPAAV